MDPFAKHFVQINKLLTDFRLVPGEREAREAGLPPGANGPRNDKLPIEKTPAGQARAQRLEGRGGRVTWGTLR